MVHDQQNKATQKFLSCLISVPKLNKWTRQMTVTSPIHSRFWDTAANEVYDDPKKAPQKARELAHLASTASELWLLVKPP